jgi:micrococcal nuclease
MKNQKKEKNNFKKPNLIIQPHLKVINVVDGDGIIVKNILTNEEFEIRLLGIDAPEIKKCPKLFQDEKETHTPGALLMQLGYISFHFLLSKIPHHANITIFQEPKNLIDIYGRVLAYVYLDDGTCINELMIKNGFAKPYNKSFCSELANYQKLHNRAKKEKKGLFKMVRKF